VVNAGSIADAAQLLIEAVPAGCFCAGCEAFFTAADGCCESPIWSPISRELRQGRELQLLSLRLPLLSLQLG
jgi:hydrogenase nickel incorporation protein HypA/HybF